MQDISGYGLRIVVRASNTFPAGFTVSQFADDADPFDLPSIEIRGKAMGVNGDMITWNVATPTDVTLAVIPGSEDDNNLSVLFQANRVGRGKGSTRDIITMVGIYPDGSSITLNPGSITNGMPGKSVASAGRMKSKTYQFSFENMVATLASTGA